MRREVSGAVDGPPDMRIPEADVTNKGGNHAILRGASVDVVLAHFRLGSLKVTVGEWVEAGQVIAEVGNSGASDEPHLHIHAQRLGTADAPLSGDPLPMRLDGRFLVRNDRVSSFVR